MTKILRQTLFMKYAGGAGSGGVGWTERPLDALFGLGLDDLHTGTGSHICLILALQRSVVRVVGWWRCFSASAHDAYHLLCRLLWKPQRPPSLAKKRILVCSWQPSGWRLSICPGGCHSENNGYKQGGSHLRLALPPVGRRVRPGFGDGWLLFLLAGYAGCKISPASNRHA